MNPKKKGVKCMVQVSNLKELDDSAVMTLKLSSEATERIKASMGRFHKTNSLADEIAELMKFAIIKTTSK